jgi:hypothetical protein
MPEWGYRSLFLLFVPIGQEKNPCNRQPDHTAYRGCDDDILINLVQLHDKPFGNWANVSCWIPGDCSSYFPYYATMMPLWWEFHEVRISCLKSTTYIIASHENGGYGIRGYLSKWSRRCHCVNLCSLEMEQT